MLTFLYIGSFLGIIIAIIFFNIKSRIYLYKRTKTSTKAFDNHLKIIFIESLLLSFSITFFISFLLPLTIWNLGAKSVGTEEMIIDDKQLYSLPNTNSKGYVGKVKNNKSTYVVNISEKNNTFSKLYIDSKNTNFISIKKNSKARYERVKTYKIKKLTSNSFLSKAVNDMYANIYLKHNEADFQSEKINLYVPDNSVVESYSVQ